MNSWFAYYALQKRPFWAALEPSIRSAKLQEGYDMSCDFEFKFGQDGKERLYVMVFDASQMETLSDKEILDYVWLNNWEDTLWVFVCDKHNEDRSTQAYMRLQMLMLDLSCQKQSIRGPSIIFAPMPAMIVPYIITYIEGLQKQTQIPRKLPIDPNMFVVYATVKPLSPYDAKQLSHLFQNVADLEEATRTEEGLKILRENFNDETVKGLVEFWEDEWIV